MKIDASFIEQRLGEAFTEVVYPKELIEDVFNLGFRSAKGTALRDAFEDLVKKAEDVQNEATTEEEFLKSWKRILTEYVAAQRAERGRVMTTEHDKSGTPQPASTTNTKSSAVVKDSGFWKAAAVILGIALIIVAGVLGRKAFDPDVAADCGAQVAAVREQDRLKCEQLLGQESQATAKRVYERMGNK